MNMDPTKEMLFPIVAKNADYAKKNEFKNIIMDTLKELVDKGLDKDQIKSSYKYR